MKLHEQVCTIDQSKRLKELGVKQDSIFNWYKANNGYELYFGDVEDVSKFTTTFSAFTVAELGEMLPVNAISWKYDKDGVKLYRCVASDNTYSSGYFDTEAEARAAMLIYLLENGLLKNTD